MSLHEKSVLMTLSVSALGMSRTDKAVTAETLTRHGATSEGGRFNKRLLPDKAVAPIRKLITEIRKYHVKMTLPWGDDGTRLLPTAHFADYTERMRKYHSEFRALVETFVKNYPDYKKLAKQMLNGMYKETDYPPQDRVAEHFECATKPTPVPDGRDFRVQVPADAMREMRNDVANRVAEAEKAGRDDLLNRIKEPLRNMVSKLNEPEAIFRDSLIGNLRSIAELIPGLNITADPEIEAIRHRVADLAKVDPDDIRESPAQRGDAAAKAQQIMDQMSMFH